MIHVVSSLNSLQKECPKSAFSIFYPVANAFPKGQRSSLYRVCHFFHNIEYRSVFLHPFSILGHRISHSYVVFVVLFSLAKAKTANMLGISRSTIYRKAHADLIRGSGWGKENSRLLHEYLFKKW